MSLLPDYTLSILVACLVVLLVILVRKRLDYFSSRGMPYIKPAWTSIFKIFSQDHFMYYPYQIYHKEQDSDHPVIGYFDGSLKPRYLIMNPSMVQKILIKDFSHFQDHGGFEFDSSRDPLGDNLFNISGNRWRPLRMKLLPTFTSGKLKAMTPAMEHCAISVIQDLHRDNLLNQDVNLKDWFKKYSLSVIASCAIGIEPESVKDPGCEFQGILRRFMAPTFFQQFKFFFAFSFPKLSTLLQMKLFPQELDDFFINMTKETMEMRKRSGIKRNDFIQLLIELKEKGSVQLDQRDLEEDEKEVINQQLSESVSTSELDMSYELLAAQVFVFLLAGFDNSSQIISLTTYLLSKHKDIQQRVREEVREAKSKHGGINYQALRSMKLLEASVNEAMRMYPPAFILLRNCTKSYTLSNGSTMDKGTFAVIVAKALHNDSRYWRNPEEFNPDRFLTDDIVPGTYMPFGDGPRLCIAQRLSLLMAKVMLAQVVDKYELLPSKITKEPLKPKSAMSTDIKGGLWAIFKPLEQ